MPFLFCRSAEEYYECVDRTSCSTEFKQREHDRVERSLTVNCSAQSTGPEPTEEAVKPTSEAPDIAKCQNAVYQCMVSYRRATHELEVDDHDILCKSAEEYYECVDRTSCSTEFKQREHDRVERSLTVNCSAQSTGPEPTEEAVKPAPGAPEVAICPERSPEISDCYRTLWKSILATGDQAAWCTYEKDYDTCLENLPCEVTPTRWEELHRRLESRYEKYKRVVKKRLESRYEKYGVDCSNRVINLEVEYLGGKRVLLIWRLSTNIRPSDVDGFKILYKKAFKKRSKSDYFVEDIQAADSDGKYSAILTLKRKSRYEIKVQPYGQQLEAEVSAPTYIQVSGKDLSVSPEIGIMATAVATNAILISYRAEGDENLENVEFLYVKENGPQWTQLYKEIVPLRGTNSVVLSGLEEGTTYFIAAKAWFDKTFSNSVTYATTLTQEPSRNLSLTKQQNSVDWSHWDIRDLQGYKATVTFNAQQPSL
ncbi:hypothetical protein RRG08_058450, partial [Elysia crispata]